MTAHPSWCRIEHAPGWPVHSGPVGEVIPAGGTAAVLVELNDLGDGRGPRVTLGVSTGGAYASAPLDGAQACEVAALLCQAAGLLWSTGGAR